MAKYESKIKMIAAPVTAVYAKLSNLENLRPILDNAANNPMVAEKLKEAGQDPSQLEKLKDVQLSADRISVPAPMVGEIAMCIIEREDPALTDGKGTIKFETEQSPIQANLWIQLLPTREINAYAPDGSIVSGTKMRLTIKADLNPMIKMMVGKKLEEGIDKLADMLAMLPY